MDICTVAEAKKRAPNDEPDIGDDIWIEILSRLHPKTLTRLKCTSKTWHRLASTAILHSQIKTPISGFFIRRVRLSTRKESIRYHHLSTAAGQSSCTDHTLGLLPRTTIIDSRHGFLLCSASSGGLQNNYFICNPATRQFLCLPKPRNRIIGKITYSCNRFVFLSATLIFDDDQYRVVRFVLGSGIDIRDYEEGEDEQEKMDMNKNGGQYLCIDIYSSKTGQWTKSKASFECGRFFYLLNRPSVLLDGAIYMLAAPQLLLRFHVKEECFEFIDLPCDNLGMIVQLPSSPSEAVSCLGVREGRLYYAYQNCRHMQVWMFDECQPSKWVLKHAVELQVFGILNPPFVGGELGPPQVTLDVLAFHPSLDAVLVRKVDGFYWYYTQSRKLERIMSCSPPYTMRFCVYRVHPISEWHGFVSTASTRSQNGTHIRGFDGENNQVIHF